MNKSEELQLFIEKIEAFSAKNCPNWLCPNSIFFGVEPGHNLDLLKISLDYRIDRLFLLSLGVDDFLKDPSALELIK